MTGSSFASGKAGGLSAGRGRPRSTAVQEEFEQMQGANAMPMREWVTCVRAAAAVAGRRRPALQRALHARTR
ncbi:hypothetical protein Y886_14050 [Xanthomonas hyacinthi DSM 19077]|nr:hypothetical protein Y886_14050 [Xanthomonas hyacinthi DSM 19077]